MILVLEALAILFFVVACGAIATRIVQSLVLLREFGTPIAVSLLLIVTLLLYPIPIFAILAIALFPLWFFLPLPVGAIFFVPHIVLSQITLRHLENSGTSRVAAVERAIRDSVWLGFGGIIYFIVFWLLSLSAYRFASDVPSL